MEEVQRAVKMIRLGDANQKGPQVKTALFAFLHENDSAGDL